MSEKDLLKIKATLLYLVNKFDRRVDYIKVFKLLYLSQRRHIEEYGLPLIKDNFIAFKAGPAPSTTYRICQTADPSNTYANKVLELYASSVEVTTVKTQKGEKKYITAKEEPDLKRLSQSNRMVLDDIYQQYYTYKSNMLSEVSHDKAWAKNWDTIGQKPKKIPINDLLLTMDLDEETKEHIRENMMLSGFALD